MNHMYCHGLGSGLWSTRLVPAGVCWPHEDVLDCTWELPLKFRDGKGELLCFWFLFLWCAFPLRTLPGGILAAEVLHLGCTLHLSPHWSSTPSGYSSHLALHCCLPSCISHWVHVEASDSSHAISAKNMPYFLFLYCYTFVKGI